MVPSKVVVAERAAEAMVSRHLRTVAGHQVATKAAATASSSSRASTGQQEVPEEALQDTLLQQQQEPHGASSSSQHKVSTAAAATWGPLLQHTVLQEAHMLHGLLDRPMRQVHVPHPL
jgi:hypothetical protein